MRPTSSRTSWTSSQENVNEKENRQSPRGTPPPSPRDRAGSFGSILANMRQERSGSIGREVTPPAITVTKDSSDSEMMPPPKAPVRRKKQIRRIESDCDINELEEPSDMPRPVSEPSGLSGLAGTLV
ncbi:uncharacterized protein LOC106171547 [Lingula anatina]|uniref:Uncharacterized protein LOC106171547 n=1 Tax=Lingula anatina TaxID=7574 RepID=A0A1S3JBY8_LINAN|nr:uncharacterized protein LOC106171547 [Lingula anatina]|eukprot:XP_013407399.1 uncharacterized protein LOC106171547 [Lingula anatina]